MAGTPIEILIKALGAEEVVAALKKVTAEGATVKKSLEDTGRSIDTLGTKAKGPLANVSKEFTGVTKSTTDFSGALKNSNPAIHDFSSSMNNAASGAPKLTTALDQTAQKGKTLTETGRTLSASFQSMMTSTVALTGTAIALFETWDSVSDAELAVQKSRNTLEQQTIRLHTLEATRNRLIEEGKTGTEQFAIVEEKLALQHNKVEVATGDLANAEENLAVIQTHFYKEIIPLTMSAGASMFQLFTTGKQGILEMASSFKGLIPAIKGAASSFSLISLTNPFFLAITIGGALIGAFVTNLFGFRDAVNGVGVAIGNALPFLKPFLEMLGAAGQWLTDTFGGGAQEAQAFEGEFSGAMEGATASAEGFQTGFTGSMDGAGKAMGGFEKVVFDGVEMSKTHLNSLITEAEGVAKQLQTIFSKSVKVDDLTLSGFHPTMSGEVGRLETKLNPTQNSQLLAADKLAPGIKDIAAVNDETGKLYVSMNRVVEIMNQAELSTEDWWKVLNILSNEMGISLETTNRNVSGYDELNKKIDEGKDVTNNATSATKNLTVATAAQAIASAQHEGAMKKLNEEFDRLWAISKSTTLSQDMLAQAQKQVQIDFMKTSLATAEQNLYLQEYSKVLGTTLGQAVHFQKGIVGQRQALLDSKIAVIESAGAYSELLKQMQTGEPQTIAYTQAVYDQKIALEQSKIEVYALQGTLDELVRQYNSGEQSVVAFNKGFIEQQMTLVETAIAVDHTRGAIEALAGQMLSGEAQITAWNKGLVEGRLETLNQAVAVHEALGALQAYHEAVSSGLASQTAYNQAVVDTNREIGEAYINLDTTRGALEEYNKWLNEGVVQYNAYHQAILDVRTAQAQLGEEVASALGTYEEHLKGLTDITTQTHKASLAFLEGKEGAIQWAEGVKTAEFEQGGMLRGLSEVDHMFGTVLPKNMPLTEEAAKNIIVAFGNVGHAAATMASESYQAGLELTSGVADAIREGGKDVDESLEELEVKIGREFPDSVKESIVSANIGQTMSETMTEGLDMMQVALANGADQIDIQKVVNGLGEDFKKSFDKLTPEVQAKAAKTMSMINFELSQGPKDETGGVQGWLNRLKSLVETIPGIVDPATQSIQNMANVDFSSTTAGMNAYKSAIDATTASIKSYNEASGGLFANATPTNDVFTKAQAQNPNYKKGQVQTPVDQTAAPTVDTSAIDAAMQKLNAFNLALAQIPTTVATIVGQANSAFVPLGDPFLNEIPAKILQFSTTLQSMPAFMSASVVTPVNTALSLIGDPFLTTIPSKILTFSTTLAQMPGFVASNVVSPIIQNFTGMANALGPIFNRVTSTAASAFMGVTNIARAEASKLATVYDNAITAMITKMAAIGNAAANIFPRVTAWARESANAVQTLANAINSLQDKTITLTTVYESVYVTRTAATGFGPAVVDKPTRLLVGESGPEFVQVTPLASAAGKNYDPERRLEIYADPGKRRQNTDPLFEMANGTPGLPGLDGLSNVIQTSSQNGVNGNNNVNVQNDSSNAINSLPNSSGNNTTGDWVDVNIAAVGGRNVSVFGGAIPIYGSGGSGSGSIGGGGGGSGSGSGGGGGSTGGSGSGGGAGNQNFNYQSNGKYYRYQNGQIDTNMTESEIAAAEAELGYKFPRNGSSPQVPSGTGGGGTGTGNPVNNGPTTIGGITFPAGFPFHDTGDPRTGGGGGGNNVSSSSGGGGGNIQQSQHVSQNSIVNQGNNSNIDMMSGTNSRLRIQNGQVIEATGIFAGYNGGPLPGLGGGGGLTSSALTGSILEPFRGRFRSGQDNQYAIFDNGAASGLYDVGITPCMLEPGAPGAPGGPGGGTGGAGMLIDIMQMMVNMLKNFNMGFNINTYLDGDRVYKNSVKKYLGNLGTFLS